MGLDDTIRKAVAKVNAATKDLQATVTIAAWTGQDFKGKASYNGATSYRALVDLTVKQRYTNTGRLVLTLATVTILDAVASTNASGRTNPIDPRDIVTLPDGRTAPIVEVKAFLDAGTNTPFLNEVTLGQSLK